MITIGYEQADRSVKYLYTSDDTLENVITSVVYRDIPLPTKVYNGEELKESMNIKAYFAEELSNEEDTRFRFLHRSDGTWLIRDHYNGVEHDIIIKKTSKNGGKKTRRSRRKN